MSSLIVRPDNYNSFKSESALTWDGQILRANNAKVNNLIYQGTTPPLHLLEKIMIYISNREVVRIV